MYFIFSFWPCAGGCCMRSYACSIQKAWFWRVQHACREAFGLLSSWALKLTCYIFCSAVWASVGPYFPTLKPEALSGPCNPGEMKVTPWTGHWIRSRKAQQNPKVKQGQNKALKEPMSPGGPQGPSITQLWETNASVVSHKPCGPWTTLKIEWGTSGSYVILCVVQALWHHTVWVSRGKV